MTILCRVLLSEIAGGVPKYSLSSLPSPPSPARQPYCLILLSPVKPISSSPPDIVVFLRDARTERGPQGQPGELKVGTAQAAWRVREESCEKLLRIKQLVSFFHACSSFKGYALRSPRSRELQHYAIGHSISGCRLLGSRSRSRP